MVDWSEIKQREHMFLDMQMRELARKYTRYQNAAPNDDCAQARLAHAVEVELALLQDLRVHQRQEDCVSLEALILHEQQVCGRRAARLAQRWRHGRPTPEAYWDAEVQRNFLGDLLMRYHEWCVEQQTKSRSNGAQNGSGERLHGTFVPVTPEKTDGHLAGLFPWYYHKPQPDNAATTDNGRPVTAHVAHEISPEVLQHELDAALERLTIPTNHLHVVAQTGGLVILTGVMHTMRACEEVVRTILDVEGVYEALVDVRIIPARFCPYCQS